MNWAQKGNISRQAKMKDSRNLRKRIHWIVESSLKLLVQSERALVQPVAQYLDVLDELVVDLTWTA